MSFHRNANLGLAGRHALVSAIADGMTLNGRGRLQRVAGDTASLVAPLASGRRGGAGDALLSPKSLESAASLGPSARPRAG
jgi:hypothetical protein